MNFIERVKNAFTSSPNVPPGPKTLLISGFGWSGSGALIDYAADYRGVGGFRRGFEEGSMLKGLYSLSVFYRGLADGVTKSVQDIENLAEALSGRPGLSQEIQPPREFVNIKRNEHMRKELGGERLDAVIADLVHQLKVRVDSRSGKYIGTPEDVFRAASAFLDELKRISVEVRFKEPPSHLILNNDPPGYSVDLFRFHRSALYTIVTRDLADVFATLVTLKRTELEEKPLREFIRAQRKKVKDFEKTLLEEREALRNSLVIVEFERFVSAADVRDAWHEFCGFSREKTGNKFDPDISRKNVGIGKELPEDAYRRILDGVELQRRDLIARLKDQSGVRVL